MSQLSLENEPRNTSATTLLDVLPSEAASVIVHRVPGSLTETFVQWQRGVTAATAQVEGYLRTEVYPPADDRETQWVVVVHFATHATLRRWLDSPQRAQWIAELATELKNFRIKTLPQGFGSWFADADLQDEPEATHEVLPPSWKMALVVLLALYPTVMLLSLLVVPWLSVLGFAFAMFISNALSVSILQWGIMPRLTKRLNRWLTLPFNASRKLNIGVALAIIVLLGCLVGLFQMLEMAK
ncbi:MAG: antibiotic biosynthesis monooxygenase [Planctomycetes bacterium]|nr:antibiotic biosynthesis monooxygenase [Planctomycetota bacterium]